MTKFVYAYTGGQMAETPEAQEKSMQEWGAWFGTLGSAVTDTGAPFGASATVKAGGGSGGGQSGLSGYTVIEVPSIDDAIARADGCPILAQGGQVEVYEAVEM